MQPLQVTRFSATLEAERPWPLPAHRGDLLRRALLTPLHQAAQEAGHPAWVEAWMDERGQPDSAAFALSVALDVTDGQVTGLRLDLRLFGALPAPAAALQDLLHSALRRMAEKGLSRAQVPHQVVACEPLQTRSLAQWVMAPPTGPLHLRLLSPLSLGRGPPVDLALSPVALFDGAVRRLAELRRRCGQSTGARLRPPGDDAHVTATRLRRFDATVQGIRNPRPVQRGGVLGELWLDGDLGDLGLALARCAVTGLGRGVTSGHGQIAVAAGVQPKDR